MRITKIETLKVFSLSRSVLAIGIGAGVGIGFGIWGNTTLPTETTGTSSATGTTSGTTTPSAATSTSTAAATETSSMPSATETSTTQETFPPMPVIDTSGITKMSCPYDVTRSTQFNLTWTPSTNDEVDAFERIGLIMEGALLFYKCYTNITIPSLIVVYDLNVPTATGSMATRTITFGANRQYHTLRVAMHELAHVLGMGTAR